MVRLLRAVAELAALAGLLAASALVAVPVVENVSSLREPGSLSQPVVLRAITSPSVIEAANGQPLYLIGASQYHPTVKLSQIPPMVTKAILDVEDHTYYLHGAIDLKGIARALVADLSGGQILQGGSTITQQLVKNAVLNQQRTLSRKVREAILSFRIEGQMSKGQILQRYLNTIYFGDGAYGVQAAAEVYFGKPVSQLTTPEGALLAVLIEDPAGLSPFLHPKAALFRRNLALQQMQRYGDLSAAQVASYSRYPLPKSPYLPTTYQPSGFVSAVIDDLLTKPAYAFLGSTPAERYANLAAGGFRIHTTLVPPDQAAAVAAVAQRLPATGGRYTAALVSIDPSNGNVVAMISGNPVKGIGGYNVATGYGGSGRQPGSGFKIFTLLTALEDGYSPADLIDGTSPCKFTVPNTHPFPYIAHNAEPGFGLVSVAKATADSINCAYIRLGVTVGLDQIETTARLMGITTPLVPLPSMVIGSEDVYPIEMAAAYGAVDNLGVYHSPRLVTTISGMLGNSVYTSSDPGRRVVSKQVAEEALAIFKQTIAYGTGTAAQPLGRPAAGKTGTTDNFTDAWFNGMVPQLATTVWMGDPAGSVPMYDVGGIPVYGGTYPTEIWEAYNAAVLAGQPATNWPGPMQSLIPAGTLIVPKYSPGSIVSQSPPAGSQQPAAAAGSTVGSASGGSKSGGG